MMQLVPSHATGRALLKGVNFLNFIWDKITEWLQGPAGERHFEAI